MTTQGETRRLTLPYSEVCMHMRVAGKEMTGRQVGPYGMVQLLNEDGSPFSAPITAGEAGWGMVGSDHTRTVWRDGRWYPRLRLVA